MPESNPLPENAEPHWSPSRREFLATTSGAVIAGVLVPKVSWAAPRDAAEPSPPAQAMNITLRVNGIEHHLEIDTRVSLLDLLREQLRLTGSKKGCNHGQCGACTVIVNGERINSCLALAVCHDGDDVTTVEGLANGNELHPIQAAFIKHDGFQCGYGTPGQICSAVAMLDEVRRNTVSRVASDVRQQRQVPLTAEEVRERMSGNLCRCGAYNGIVAAILEASGSIDHNPADMGNKG